MPGESFESHIDRFLAIIGSQPGQYLIRRADDTLVQPSIQITTVSTADCIPKYQGVVNYPTASVCASDNLFP